jgi:hypothetical protein
MRRFIIPILFAIALAIPACSLFSPDAAKSRCLQMAKAACLASSAIPTVGATVSALCELYVTSETVTKACEAAGNKVSNFFGPLGDWLKKHGLGGLVPKASLLIVPPLVPPKDPIALAPLPDGGPPSAPVSAVAQ